MQQRFLSRKRTGVHTWWFDGRDVDIHIELAREMALLWLVLLCVCNRGAQSLGLQRPSCHNIALQNILTRFPVVGGFSFEAATKRVNIAVLTFS